MPPVPASGDTVFGGPGSIPSLSDDEERYALLLFESFLTVLLFLCRVCLIFCFTCSDAGDVTSPRHEAAASPARVASPVNAPTPPQPETTPTTPAPSVDKVVAAPDLAASSSRPATWEEHVSVLFFNMLCIFVGFRVLMYCFAAVWSCSMRGWQGLLRDGAGKGRTPRPSRNSSG